jgi:hypothetical protein
VLACVCGVAVYVLVWVCLLCVCGVSGLNNERAGLCVVLSDMGRVVAGMVLWAATGRASGLIQPGEERAWRWLSKGKC